MATGTVFITNRTQAVRLPADARGPGHVEAGEVRSVGQDGVIAADEAAWDSFFLDGPTVTEDFMAERADQHQPDRDAL